MIRTIVAFPSPEVRAAASGMLEKNGIAVREQCATGAEVIRAVKRMGGGVVVCACRLADMTVRDLASALDGTASLLAVGRPADLELCMDTDVFRATLPIKASELSGSVSILLQIDEMRARQDVPRRSTTDEKLVSEAKRLLMLRSGMTEEQAHRYLQKRSMEDSAKMADTARRIIRTLDHGQGL